MPQKRVDLVIKPTPVQTSATAQVVVGSFDLAALPGGVGNITDCTLNVLATLTAFGTGGSGYSVSWNLVADVRRDGAGNAVVSGSSTANGAGSGRVGDSGLDTSSIDWNASGTVVRLRATPSDTGARWWYTKFQIFGIQGA